MPTLHEDPGGLNPVLVSHVQDIYGEYLVHLVPGGIHGHPKGTRAETEAFMQVIDAWEEGVRLEEKTKKAKEPQEVPGRRGHCKPV